MVEVLTLIYYIANDLTFYDNQRHGLPKALLQIQYLTLSSDCLQSLTMTVYNNAHNYTAFKTFAINLQHPTVISYMHSSKT